MKKNINYLQLKDVIVGNERRAEMFDNLMDRSTFLPKTLTFKDIDEAFKAWVEESIVIINGEGQKFPTFTLYSNQRFNEYSQSWQYVDENKNLLLNFKTVTRESNSDTGTINSHLYNIPGYRWYTIQQGIVLDDNGSESFMRTKMHEPMAVNLSYKVGVFTTTYETLNTFGEIITKLFSARQAYICPNGHYLPMTLEGIQDTSENSIDDREYYGQECTIKVMGYILTEDDFQVEEFPLKKDVYLSPFNKRRFYKPEVEIEEVDTLPDIVECTEPVSPYYYQPVILTLTFEKCRNLCKFVIDTDMAVVEVKYENVNENCTEQSVNDENVVFTEGFEFKKNDNVRVRIRRRRPDKPSKVIIYGYCPNVVYDEREDDGETVLDDKNLTKELTYK